MHLTSKQEEALKSYMIDKIDELDQYLIINREAAQFIFTKLIDQTLTNAMAFIHKLRSELPKWKLADNHPLISAALKESNEQKLFDFFNFLRLQGDYCKELKETENIEFTGAEILNKINDIFYSYITNEVGLKLPLRQNNADVSEKEKDMGKLLLVRYSKEPPKFPTIFVSDNNNTPKQLSKNDLVKVQKEISEKLNLLYEYLVLNGDEIIIQLFQELIKNVMKTVNSIINDVMDLDDDFKMSTSSLARGSGQNIFKTVSAFRKNLAMISESKDETAKAEINKLSAALSFTYTPFGIEDVHPDQNIVDWHEHRLRIEQERLNSTSSATFYETLSKVKKLLNKTNTIKNCYILCAENEMGSSELFPDNWTYTFIETLTNDLKMAGLNINSSQSCARQLISAFSRKEKINLAKNIFIMGTKTLLPAIKKNNSAASWEMQFALGKAEEGVPLIFVLLSGTKAISFPNPSHLPQLNFLMNREESSAKVFSYIELLKFFITYSVGDELSKQCNSYWYELELHSKIPSGGISHEEVLKHSQKKDIQVHKASEEKQGSVIKISNTNGVLKINNMQFTGGEKIKLKDSKLSLTLKGNNFLMEGIGAKQSTAQTSLDESFPIKVVVNVNCGNAVFLSGNHPNLGKWEKAIRLSYIKDNVWSAELPISTLGCEFKFLFGSDDIGATAPVSALIWEEGPNRKLASKYYDVDSDLSQTKANIYR